MWRKAFLSAALPAVLFVTPAGAGGFDGAEAGSSDGRWSGVYVGLHGGYGWTDTGGDYDFGPFNDILFDYAGLSPSVDTELDGYIVGGHIGIQRQLGRIVLGIEASGSATDMEGSSSVNWEFDDIEPTFLGLFGVAGSGVQTLEAGIDNLFTLTGRIGFTHNDLLIYFKGGYASADISVTSSISGSVTACAFSICPSFPFSTSDTSDKRHDGYVLGAGFERMLHPNVTLGVEYNYIDLGSRTYSMSVLEIEKLDISKAYKVRVDPDEIHAVTVRLNFLLNSPREPEVASLK